MTKLQWLFIGSVSVTLLSFIFFLFYLLSYVLINKKAKQKSESQDNITDQQLRHRMKKCIKKTGIFLMFTLISGSGAGYIAYYQATNLSDTDSTNLSEGYFYLSDLKKELEMIQEGKEDEVKSQSTINHITTAMSSYSIKKASTLNTVEGQRILNRYYQAMAELGLNISRESRTLSSDPEAITESLEDIEKLQTNQEKVLEFYQVDIAALEAQK